MKDFVKTGSVFYVVFDPKNDSKFVESADGRAVFRKEILEWIETNTPSAFHNSGAGPSVLLSFGDERDAAMFKLFWKN